MYFRASPSRPFESVSKGKTSGSFTRAGLSTRPLDHPIFALQRTIGTQNTERLLRTQLEDSASVPPISYDVSHSPSAALGSSPQASSLPRLGHSFSRVSVNAPGYVVESRPTAPPPIQDTDEQAALRQADEEEQEDFQPAEYYTLTDEDLHVRMADSNEDGERLEEASTAPPVRFVDRGRVGTLPYGESLVGIDARFAHAFTDSGRTGATVWGGGGGPGTPGTFAGPHTNEPNGSVQANGTPVYESRSKGLFSDSEAWMQAGTGTLDVTRSWTGVNAGDQGNGWYLTPGAAARFDDHERLHVNRARAHYTTHIVPLLARVKDFTPSPAGGDRKATAYTQIGARYALRSIILWPESVKAFQDADITDNSPGGPVDAADLASGTYPIDAGPGAVGGTPFAHRVRLPAEPNPV
jgi:hypothetical protein